MNNRRHQWDAQWCDILERIAVGRSAEAVLQTLGQAKTVGIATLPAWLWVTPGINVGRRLAASGRTLPVRIAWSVPEHVVVLRQGAAPLTIQWEAKGLGVQYTGEITVSLDESARSNVEIETGASPSDKAVPALLIAGVRSVLRRLANDGHSAMWEALSILHDYAQAIAPKHLFLVTKEIYGGADTAGGELLDAISLEAVVDRYVIGDGSMVAGSRAMSLVNRCLEPATFARVDPLRFVRRSIHRDIEEGIRYAIGDPHIGQKVRALVRGGDEFPDIASVVRAYQAQYPSDRLGEKRAAAALTVQLSSTCARPASPDIEMLA